MKRVCIDISHGKEGPCPVRRASLPPNRCTVMEGALGFNVVELIKGHAMTEHVHLVLSVPPKYSIAMVVRYLKRYPPPVASC
jgi:hypothetical protein